MDAVAAANQWGIPPLHMLGITAKPAWTGDDRLLAQAWSINQALRCHGCGLYVDETHGVDGWHEAESVVCDGCRALEEAQKDGSDPDPGTKWFVPRVMD